MQTRAQLALSKALRQSAFHLMGAIDRFEIKQLMVLGNNEELVVLLQETYYDAEIYSCAYNKLPAKGAFDLIFANDGLQYITKQEAYITQLFGLLASGGLLAVQLPNALNMPIQVMLEQIANDKPWKEYFNDIMLYYYEPAYYYEILHKLTDSVCLWKTYYQMVFSHYQEIVDLYALTEMKSYMNSLPTNKMRETFQNNLVQLLPAAYKKQSNQAILFPYRRTFFIAKKQ